MEELDEGTAFIENWIATFPGKDRCHFCKKKVGWFPRKVPVRFGLHYVLCEDCYEEYKKKNNKT